MAGHIIIMEDERLAGKVLNGKFHNTGPVGKPRTRWENVVRRDTTDPRNTRMEETPPFFSEWRRVLRGTRAQKGL